MVRRRSIGSFLSSFLFFGGVRVAAFVFVWVW
jgi:hypothetical protein